MTKKCISCGILQTCSCDQCHSCTATGTMIPYVEAPPLPPVGDPTTQKLKGLLMLASAVHQGYNAYAATALQVPAWFKVKDPLPAFNSMILSNLQHGGLFARPCPPSPEHGFVESRIVKSIEEIEALRLETLSANEDSEIMLTPRIDAKLNAIWTPTSLAIGPGHDGATAGKGAILIPLAGMSRLSKTLLKSSGVPEDKDPYVEAVSSFTPPSLWTHYLTQLRAGTKLPSAVSPDYVPQDLTVKEVIQTNGEDLLAWAKVVKELSKKEGIVVYHPGGVLTDHYCVHCREGKVPIFTTHSPAIGEVLEAKDYAQIPPLDPHAMLDGIIAGDLAPMRQNLGSWIALALLALHNSAALRGPHSFWIGAGVAATLKLGMAALQGEARHAHNAKFKIKPDIYGYYGGKSLTFQRARLSRITQILHYGFGDPETGKSFGGRKWALCGAALCPLFNGVRKLALDPTEENASTMLLALNIAINQAHNGGWWLNKFVNVAIYDDMPKGDPAWMVYASPAAWQAHGLREEVSKRKERFLERVKSWPEETSIAPLKWRKVGLDIGPGSFILKLKAATVPNPMQVVIPATTQLINSMITKAGEVKIVPGEVQFVTPDGKNIPIWKEKILAQEARDLKK